MSVRGTGARMAELVRIEQLEAEVAQLRAENERLLLDKEAISRTASDYLHEIERLVLIGST